MKDFKKVLCCIFALILMFNLVMPTVALSLDANSSTVLESQVKCNVSLEDDFADDRVMVVLSNTQSLKLRTYSSNDFSEIGCETVTDITLPMKNQVQVALQTQNQVRTTSNEPFEATVNTETYHQVLCLKLKQAGKANVLKAIKQLEQRDDVVYVGPDYAVSLIDAVPNDPEYSTQQWAPQKIRLPQAWEYNTTGVTVGILDTGIDATHPDLANRISTTKNRDFTSGVELLVNAPTDPNGHGTHVAGIIGARSNNGIGISGVCWNTTLVSLRVLDDTGNGYASHVALAVMSAQQQNIPILNFGGGWLGNDPCYDYALDLILKNYYGLFVCSAGNERINCDLSAAYPTSFQIPNVIAVGASEQNDTPWLNDFVASKGTNYGKNTVDIFAPGDYIVSTYPGGEYAFLSGTSMAASYVTGVAALMMAENPLLSPAAIKQILIRTANKVTDYTGAQIFGNLCVSRGLLDAYAALSACHLHTSDIIEREEDWHTVGFCDCCEVSDIEQPHVFIPYVSMDNTKHLSVCACGYIKQENHIFDYSILSVFDPSKMYVSCACGAQMEESGVIR